MARPGVIAAGPGAFFEERHAKARPQLPQPVIAQRPGQAAPGNDDIEIAIGHKRTVRAKFTMSTPAANRNGPPAVWHPKAAGGAPTKLALSIPEGEIKRRTLNLLHPPDIAVRM